jgi:hypothetical protein
MPWHHIEQLEPACIDHEVTAVGPEMPHPSH